MEPNIASSLSRNKLDNLLKRLGAEFDKLAKQNDCFKVGITSHGLMAVSNLVKRQPNDHASRIAQMALDMVAAASNIVVDVDNPDLGSVPLRVALHSGPVLADVVGNRALRYCLFGVTLTTVSMLGKKSEPYRILCSERTSQLVKSQNPEISLEARGKVSHRGELAKDCFWVKPGTLDSRRYALERARAKQKMRLLQVAASEGAKQTPTATKPSAEREPPIETASTHSERKVRFGNETMTKEEDVSTNMGDLEETLMTRLSRAAV